MKRNQLKTKFADIYKIHLAGAGLRYKCYYCGLAAPDLDHVPPLAAVESLLDMGYDRNQLDFVKVPTCKECNHIAGDEPHLTIGERFLFVKYCLYKKYRKKFSSLSWSQEELDELHYTLRVMVQAHDKFSKFLTERLAWGYSSPEAAIQAVGDAIGRKLHPNGSVN